MRLGRTQLVLLITPRVVGTALEGGQVVTGEMRKATPVLEQSIRRAPRPLPRAPSR